MDGRAMDAEDRGKVGDAPEAAMRVWSSYETV
jgi:hypothetical protein